MVNSWIFDMPQQCKDSQRRQNHYMITACIEMSLNTAATPTSFLSHNYKLGNMGTGALLLLSSKVSVENKDKECYVLLPLFWFLSEREQTGDVGSKMVLRQTVLLLTCWGPKKISAVPEKKFKLSTKCTVWRVHAVERCSVISQLLF